MLFDSTAKIWLAYEQGFASSQFAVFTQDSPNLHDSFADNP